MFSLCVNNFYIKTASYSSEANAKGFKEIQDLRKGPKNNNYRFFVNSEGLVICLNYEQGKGNRWLIGSVLPSAKKAEGTSGLEEAIKNAKKIQLPQTVSEQLKKAGFKRTETEPKKILTSVFAEYQNSEGLIVWKKYDESAESWNVTVTADPAFESSINLEDVIKSATIAPPKPKKFQEKEKAPKKEKPAKKTKTDGSDKLKGLSIQQLLELRKLFPENELILDAIKKHLSSTSTQPTIDLPLYEEEEEDPITQRLPSTESVSQSEEFYADEVGPSEDQEYKGPIEQFLLDISAPEKKDSPSASIDPFNIQVEIEDPKKEAEQYEFNIFRKITDPKNGSVIRLFFKNKDSDIIIAYTAISKKYGIVYPESNNSNFFDTFEEALTTAFDLISERGKITDQEVWNIKTKLKLSVGKYQIDNQLRTIGFGVGEKVSSGINNKYKLLRKESGKRPIEVSNWMLQGEYDTETGGTLELINV